ncbi:MAG: sulfatase-like hydrolase/transferase [Bacteroidetes bacterium]|nr:sulfatase-like hydrolase/transferase [Bacteroidota bacterium]MBU1718064.1 sulfatase-like hydrolase/transferase [Bacteroidota bacterium]
MNFKRLLSKLQALNIRGTQYPGFTICCLYFVLAPLLFEFLNNYTNPNNSTYINGIHLKHYVKIFSVIVLFVGLINIPFLFLKKWGKTVFFIAISIVLFVPAIVDFTHVLIFGARANSSSWYSIFATHKGEALEFIFDYSSFHLVLSIIAFILIPVGIYFAGKLLFSNKIKKLILALYLCCYGATIIFTLSKSEFRYINEISAFSLCDSYKDYKDEIKNLILSVDELPVLNVNNRNSHDSETHIIVIGESTSKYHLQLYGYKRPTNPELEKIRNRLIIFNDVKASYAHTIASLSEALFLDDKYTLIDLFNAAGIKTYWLSNQRFIGENETIISSLANRTSKRTFIDPVSDNKLDEVLLVELDKALQENAKRKVIFVHLMGTHLGYENRYPATFNHFTEKNISPFGDHADSFINHYDNALLYNDFIVSEIIKRCDTMVRAGSVVYFSDHGDEVYDFRDFHGHSQALLSKYMTDIPFIVFLNDSMKKARQIHFGENGINTEKELSLKNFTNTMQDLLGYESDYFDETQSYFYNDTAQQIMENTSAIDSASAVRWPFSAKISKKWAHRVNSLERLKIIQGKFQGIELDIIYENGKLDVRHPPAESIGLSLEEYFETVNDIGNHYFWLDLKNLTAENQAEVLGRLDILSEKFRVKAQIILETTEPELIPKMQKEGYCTSYYLPEIANLSNTERLAVVKIIEQNIATYNISTISQSIDNYKLMSELFPKTNKLIWSLTSEWNNVGNHERINSLLKSDTTIRVCLVNYSTDGWR